MKCEIEWIDCKGNPTAHDAEAIGYAVLGEKKFAICEEHKRTLDSGASHHDANCSHILPKPLWLRDVQWGNCLSRRAPWRFEPLEKS